jgi:hypothetical protein
MPDSHERRNITWRVRTLLCFSFVFLVGDARAQTAPEPQAKEAKGAAFTPVVVENVTIQGANDLGADETAKLAESLNGEAYTDKWLQKLTDNVKLYLQNKGFLDAKAKPTVRSLNSTDGKQHVAVTVEVVTGPRYTVSQILWTGSSVFTTKQLDDMILLRTGDVGGLTTIGESQVLLDKIYWEHGYPKAFVAIVFHKYADVGKVALYGEIQEGEKSSGDQAAAEKEPECTAPTTEEIRKEAFAPRAVSYDPKVDAQLEIERAKLEAERTNRNVLLIAGGEWCGWCHMLDQTFQSSIPTRELRDRNFVVVHVNVSEANNNSCALRPYPQATGFPFLYVINAEGKLLAISDTREFESPYGYNATKIEEFLKKW